MGCNGKKMKMLFIITDEEEFSLLYSRVDVIALFDRTDLN